MDFRLGSWSLTLYKINRDHSRKLGCFRVNVPEAGQNGVGFQLPTAPFVYGASVVHHQHVKEKT